ncbi:Hypothetical protein BN69_1974 [Methylocystis sp. SC2]|nr:Hypothetical protein BN69_1974 [Methylocystis sp. SC2]
MNYGEARVSTDGQSDGRSRAKAQGVHMGRPPKLTRHPTR